MPASPLAGTDEILHGTGNHVHIFSEFGVITFPVKHRWWENADIELIERSAEELVECKKALKEERDDDRNFYIPRVGCGAGKLLWSDVKPILERYFVDDSYIIVFPR